VTIKKTTHDSYPPPIFEAKPATLDNKEAHVPAHKDFREKYFQGFRKAEVTEPKNDDGGDTQ
jgi:tRNA (guanine10-N2)-methyltransferase